MMHLLSVIYSSADFICFPPLGRVRRRRWFGTLLVGMILAAAGVPSGRLAAAELSLPTVVAHTGTSVAVSVEYSPQGEAFTALQFDLEFDESVLSITATAGSATTNAGKVLAQAVLPNGNIRFLIFGLNQNVILDGSVVDLTIQVSKSALAGPYMLDFLNALGADSSGQTAPITVHFGQVIVVNFVGTPGKANCYGQSVSVLAQQYGGLDAAAAALGFPSIQALQDAIRAFCGG